MSSLKPKKTYTGGTFRDLLLEYSKDRMQYDRAYRDDVLSSHPRRSSEETND